MSQYLRGAPPSIGPYWFKLNSQTRIFTSDFGLGMEGGHCQKLRKGSNISTSRLNIKQDGKESE